MAASKYKWLKGLQIQNPNAARFEQTDAAAQRLDDAVREAGKALGRLRLEDNPVSAEPMTRAVQFIGELHSGKAPDLEGLLSEVATALVSGPTSTPQLVPT